MSDRGEHRKGPIVRYGRRGRQRKSPPSHAGSGLSGPDQSTPSPVTRATPVTSAPPMSSPRRVSIGRRRGGGGGLRLMGTLLGVLIVIAAVVVPVISVGNSVQVPSFAPLTTTSPPSTATSAQRSAPAPHRATSYLTVGGLRAGLAHIARLAHGARLTIVRVAADSLSANAALPNGTSKEIIFEPTGTFVVAGSSTGERPIPMAQIRPIAVTRIVAAMRRRFHVPVSRIDYIVLSSPSGAPTQWITFTKAPNHPGYSASLNGTGLARLPG